MCGILSGVRIVECSTSMAAALASMMLAEAGAVVIKVERSGSLKDPAPGFAVANRSKRSVVFDFETTQGLASLDALLNTCDLFIHDLSAQEAAQWALRDGQLQSRFPPLVVVTVSGMPLGHSQDELPLQDSLVLAAGGIFDYLQPATRENGPVFVRFPLGTQCAAYLAACGAVAQLRNRQSGAGVGPVHTSLLQGAFIPLSMLCQRATQPTAGLQTPPKNFINVLLECADGKWLHLMSPADHVPSVAKVMEAMEPAERERLRAELPPYMAHVPNFYIYKIVFKQRDSAELLADLWAHDVAVEAAEPVGKLFYDEQVKANQLVQEILDPVLGPVLQPTVPYVTTPPSCVKFPRRLAGVDTQDVLKEIESMARMTTLPSQISTKLPLAGLRVLDFGNFLAGPLTTELMSEMGATVIKLEATSGDQMRWAEWAFCVAARGKRSIAVNLKDPSSRVVIERLVKWADVVHHNLRMPAATKLHLDYESLKAINPAIIYSHVNAYGPVGPRSGWPGFDQMMQSSAGWEVESAGEGNIPVWVRLGMTDHLCALSSLQATLLALYARDQTGQGQFTSTSLLGATVMSLAEFVARPDAGVEPAPKLDKAQMGLSPTHRMYRCQDGWISLLAKTTDDFSALLHLTQRDDEPKLVGHFSDLPVHQAISLCQRAGVAVARVAMQDDGSLLDNEEFKKLGLTRNYTHPVYGNLEMLAQSWHFPGAASQTDLPAPTLGQHTTSILREMSFSDDEIATMFTSGLVVETLRVAAV